MGREGVEECMNLSLNVNLLARDVWDVPGRRHGRKKCILSDLRFP
jgi:hypothetical protein